LGVSFTTIPAIDLQVMFLELKDRCGDACTSDSTAATSARPAKAANSARILQNPETRETSNPVYLYLYLAGFTHNWQLSHNWEMTWVKSITHGRHDLK
jgi:hypothetical protein